MCRSNPGVLNNQWQPLNCFSFFFFFFLYVFFIRNAEASLDRLTVSRSPPTRAMKLLQFFIVSLVIAAVLGSPADTTGIMAARKKKKRIHYVGHCSAVSLSLSALFFWSGAAREAEPLNLFSCQHEMRGPGVSSLMSRKREGNQR